MLTEKHLVEELSENDVREYLITKGITATIQR